MINVGIARVSGQTVQNMNILFGLKDETGLDSVQGPL